MTYRVLDQHVAAHVANKGLHARSTKPQVSHANLQNMKFADEEGTHLLLRPTLEEDSLEIVPQVEESVVPSDV